MQTVERAAFDQSFNGAFAARATRNATAKIEQTRKLAAFFTRFANRIHGRFADAFDRLQTKANAAFDNRKLVVRFVDISR